VVASIVLFALGYGELLYDRFVVAQQRSNIQDISSARTVFWAIALGKMLEFPVTFITGFGWSVYEQWDIFRYATHNSYLNILFNLGFIGLTLFVTVAVTTAAAARRALAHAPPDLAPHLIAFVFGFLTVFAAIFFGELSTPWIFIWAYAGVTMRLAVAIPATKPVAASYVKVKFGGVTRPAGMPVAWKRTN
jgi:O-antigen ligase